VLIKAKQKLLFIGDSITDADCRTTAAPYGNGYVSMVRNMLLARYPERELTVVNKGVSGNTSRDLDKRWEQDVIAQNPDWLSVCIGINDVWRHFDGHPAEAVPVDEYRTTLIRLLNRVLEATNARLILAEPYMIESSRKDPMRVLMDIYGATVRDVGEQFGAIVVHTQAAFDAALDYSKTTDWSTDRIHPNDPGHSVIALAFLRALDFVL